MTYDDDENALRHQLRANGVQHNILKSLRDSEGLDADGIWAAMLAAKASRLISPDDLRSRYLASLLTQGLLVKNDGKYRITLEGFSILNFLDLKAPTVARLTTKVTRVQMQASGRYLGEELKATCMRRGAYDFLALPSKMGDQLVAHPTAHLLEAS